MLIVEDDDELRELVADVLEQRGLTVHHERDGEHALTWLGEVGAQLILLDLTLPDMTGAEFLDRRDHEPALARIPVVIVSGSRSASALAADRRIPVLEKPFRTVDLVHVVERHLAERMR